MKTLFILLAALLNQTWSPDSTKCAYTRDNDIYVREAATGQERRLTSDGSDVILNGVASWVYYEEIFGRASRYRAFWWSPDSRKLAFYRFDNASVPVFPIYSPFGQDGSLSMTRYPKVGETNPSVRIAIVDLEKGSTVWADFDGKEDQYFGTPFWSDDGEALYVQREPRVQNTLDLYRVSASDGSKELVYHETYPTWLDWISGMLFADDGLYMVRAFETGWEQIYFLSYDGKKFRRLTDGENWRVKLHARNPRTGDIWFSAQRDSRARTAVYKLNRRGKITPVTPLEYNATDVEISSDYRKVSAKLSNLRTRPFNWDNIGGGTPEAADTALALPYLVSIEAEDGQPMWGTVLLPKNYDASRRYPLHFEIYGGPNTAYVTDRWRSPDQWWSDNGIIHIVADGRAAGHGGRAGTDLVFKDLTSVPVRDFLTWARWAKENLSVDPERIGVEGFSFGGTMTAMLLLRHGDVFRCGIAGGGVYDWALYDSHYTERFMLTPELNPEGFETAKTLNYAKDLPAGWNAVLRLTHGTGDDNVHCQNTLQLVDALQKAGVQFELMLYPDGMHGYRGYQGKHSSGADHAFWLKNLKQ